MYLLSDIGNTRVKLGIFEDKNNTPIYYKPIEHSNAVDLVNELNNIKNNYPNIENVFYSSVSLKVNDLFEGSVEDCFDMKPYRVTHHDIKLKDNLYEPKDAVGIDRLLSTYKETTDLYILILP